MPTKESLDRARTWYGESGLVPDEHQVVHDAHFACSESEPFELCANRLRDEIAENEINSLALLLDRMRLEGKIEAVKVLMGRWKPIANVCAVDLATLDRALSELNQHLAALNQPRPLRAGEKEG